MAHVLEFESARLQLHIVLLRELGVPGLLSWRVLGTPRNRVWDGDLYAVPLLIATRRDGAVCIFDLKAGPTPADVTDERALLAALDAAVVRQYLERRGNACSSISSWLVYSDGGRIEISASMGQLVELRQRAQRAMREHELSATSTQELAGRWRSLVKCRSA